MNAPFSINVFYLFAVKPINSTGLYLLPSNNTFIQRIFSFLLCIKCEHFFNFFVTYYVLPNKYRTFFIIIAVNITKRCKIEVSITHLYFTFFVPQAMSFLNLGFFTL